MVLIQTILVTLYLPNTWRGEKTVAKYRTILREINKEVNGLKQGCNITAVLMGTDALVEFQPSQELFTGMS